MASLFGFNITKEKKDTAIPSPVKPTSENVSVTSHYGVIETGFVYNQQSKNSLEQKIKERWALHENSEVMFAVDEIVNEMVDFSQKTPVEFTVEDEKVVPKKLQDAIAEELDFSIGLFGNINDVIKKWYVQGCLAYFIQLDKSGKEIVALHEIKPWHVKLKQESKIQTNENGIFTYTQEEKYWLYEQHEEGKVNVIKLPYDSVLFIDVGLPKLKSYLDYATKPMNDLLSLENASVIYRITRAPEKRAFYVDTGQLPPTKAEEMVKSLMNRFKTKIDYDSSTGKVTTSNKNIIAATTDYWMPRREGSTGTEIDIINESSSSLTNIIEEINHFKSKLYSALFIPKSRLDTDTTFSLGNQGTITREEVKFSQLITKLESEFMKGIYHLVGLSLRLKGKVTEEEWKDISANINITFINNDFFAETKRLENISQKVDVLDRIRDYIGKWYSMEFVQKEVLSMTDEEIKAMLVQIEKEKKAGMYDDNEEDQ